MKQAVWMVSLFVGSIAMAGVWAVTIPSPELLDIEVIHQGDPAGTDRITHLHLLVRNLGDTQLAPIFFVPGGALMNWYEWQQADGLPVVAPGATENIILTSPPYTGIPYGSDFRVIAHNGDGVRLGSTGLVPFDVERVRVAALNPAFQYWEHQMYTNVPMPYGWVPLDRTLTESRWAVTGGDGNLTMRLWPQSDRNINSTLVVRQAIDMPDRLRVVTDPAMLRVQGNTAVAAMIIEDVYAERRIDIQFLPPGSPVLPVETGRDDAGEWIRMQTTSAELDLDVPGLFEAQGWPLPAQRIIERLDTAGPGNIGFGAAATLAGAQRLEIMRPIELEMLLVSRPPHSLDMLQITFHEVGGPALDPAPSRF